MNTTGLFIRSQLRLRQATCLPLLLPALLGLAAGGCDSSGAPAVELDTKAGEDAADVLEDLALDSREDLASEAVPAVCAPGEYVAAKNGLCYTCNAEGTGYADDGFPIDDGNVCSDDACDPQAGLVHSFNSGPCDDGDPQTAGDKCLDGICRGDTVTCLAGKHFGKNGSCWLCNDLGTGRSGEGIPLDDGNVCTDDSCDPDFGIQHADNSAACDDGNPATSNDICISGACTGSQILCTAGLWVSDNELCRLCNAAGSGFEGEGVPMDDLDPCTDDACDPVLGLVHSFNSGPCDDADPDTVLDACTEGSCVGLPVVCPAGEHFPSDGSCALCNDTGTALDSPGDPIDDGNACTDDLCDPATGSTHAFNTLACDDGNAQTAQDSCDLGVCQGVPLTCLANQFFLAGDVCFLCNPDGTGAEGDGTPVKDGDLCTDDLCAPTVGVQHPYNKAPCDDDNPETIDDTCKEGACTGTALVCPAGKHFEEGGLCTPCNADGTGTAGPGQKVDDGNLCTLDACDSAMGVKHLFNSVPCDDGNPATANDWCQDGVCKGAAQVCPKGDYYPVGGLCLLCKADGSGPVGPGSAVDDGNVCTDDFCDPGDGILHWDNGQPCDDGNPATKWDWCHSGGKCYGTPVVCDAGDYFVKEGLCWLCNGSGTGTVGAGLAIDDGNLCTDDACDPGGGVEHYFNHAPCSDGKPDTLLDTCNDGTCIGVPKLCPPNEWVNTGGWWCILCDATGTQWANDGVDVDDVEDCTEDICDPKAGVIHTPVEGECWDADECTENDTCSNGKCAGTPIDCFDDNVCSQDGCDPATGQCTYQAVAGKCNDGLAATPDDVCVGVVCVGMLDPDGDKIPNYGTGPKCDGPGLLVNCQDNCPYRANATQVDSNNDGTGDACTEPRWWMRVATTKKVVALTFDDGWDNDAFEAILDALAAEKAYATFFFSGLYLDDWTIEPPTLIRAEKAGHLLGNHTFHHKLGGSLGETVQELLLCDQEFVAAGVGSVRPLFRPAGTELALWINIALQQTLFTEAFFANFDASDWLAPEPPAAALTQCILDKVAPGDIIDLHVGPEVTPAALPQILKGLKAAGYEMLTVEQMLAFGQPELVAVDAVKTCEDYF